TIETGEQRRLTKPPPEQLGDSWPAFSPEGKQLAFLRERAFRLHQIHLVSIPEGETRPLTPDQEAISGLAWTPDARHIVFSAFREGVSRLWRIAATGG